MWANTFSKSILPTYYVERGLSLNNILFGCLLTFVGQLACILFFRNFSSRRGWQISQVVYFTSVLLIINMVNPAQYYLSTLLSGVGLFFFFTFYNVAHFRETPTEKRGESSALMFVVGPLVGIFAPLLAGATAQLNIILLWVGAAVFFAFSFFQSTRQVDFNLKYSLGDALKEVKSTRFIIFIQGFWEALTFGIIPVYTLFFLKEPLSYGALAAYLAAVGIISNLTLGRLSDKLQKRAIFLYPTTILLALITFLFPFATHDLKLWALVVSAITFLMPLFWNFSIAVVIDSHTNLDLAIPGRELVLAIGRIIGLLVAFISFSIEKEPKYIFIVLGLVMLLYPLSMYWNIRIKKHYSYL